MKELMNSFRAPGMSQILGVGLRWRQDKIRRTQNPNIQRERSYPQHQARVCVVGETNKVRADLNPLGSRARGLVRRDPFQVSRAQDFQVLFSLQALTLGNTTCPPPRQVLPSLPWQAWLPFLLQVGVTVLEAQKLVGVNINPYVAVRVGEQRRVTATQRGTNCPFYNEVRVTKMERDPG